MKWTWEVKMSAGESIHGGAQGGPVKWDALLNVEAADVKDAAIQAVNEVRAATGELAHIYDIDSIKRLEH